MKSVVLCKRLLSLDGRWNRTNVRENPERGAARSGFSRNCRFFVRYTQTRSMLSTASFTMASMSRLASAASTSPGRGRRRGCKGSCIANRPRIFVHYAQNKTLSFDTIDKIRLVSLLKREEKSSESAKNLCQTGKKRRLIRQNHQNQAAENSDNAQKSQSFARCRRCGCLGLFLIRGIDFSCAICYNYCHKCIGVFCRES